jgi:hypothetical protein
MKSRHKTTVDCMRKRDQRAARNRRHQTAAAGSEPPPPEPWEPPIPLATVPTADPFPVGVLPRPLADFAEDAAAALGCPADYVGVPLLVIAGAAIGSTRGLEVKPGYAERPCVYAAVVGPPGTAKTPALKLAAGPVYAEQGRRVDFYRKAKQAHEDGIEDTPPTLSTLYVSDITTEKLAEVMQENSRGVALVRDELSAWVGGMDQYRARGRGADRQFFLSAWAGEAVSVHRKNQDDGPVFVAHPFVGVVGGLPPDLLARLRGEHAVSDGFLDRLLFSYPEPPPAVGESWASIPADALDAWRDTLAHLWGLQHAVDADGRKHPHYVPLAQSGRKVWQQFTDALAGEMNADGFPDYLRGPWSKMRGYCARLALIVHHLRLATGEEYGDEVDGDTLECGAALVRYFMSHARKVYHALDADRRTAAAQKLWGWITREQRTEFKRWEAHKDLRSDATFPTLESLDSPLALLVQHQLIRPRDRADRRGPGRRPATMYDVNPLACNRASGESGKSWE